MVCEPPLLLKRGLKRIFFVSFFFSFYLLRSLRSWGDSSLGSLPGKCGDLNLVPVMPAIVIVIPALEKWEAETRQGTSLELQGQLVTSMVNCRPVRPCLKRIDGIRGPTLEIAL